jgi:hypothetical protein
MELEYRHGIDIQPDQWSIVAVGRGVADPWPGDRRYHHPDFDKKNL